MSHSTRSLARRAWKPAAALLCAALLMAPSAAPPPAAAAGPAPALQLDPSVYGQWSGPIDIGVTAIHTSVLPNGKVMLWSRVQNGNPDALGFSQTYVLDPATLTYNSFPFNSTTNLFCSGHSFLPDGRLLVTGGHHGQDGWGEPHANIYDSNTGQWSRTSDMNAGRWYPTNCALGNGETLVVSGNIGNGQGTNILPQVYQTGSGTWRSLTNAQSGIVLYPWMLLAPNGRVFNAGPDQATRYLATSGAGQWHPGPSSNHVNRDYGGAVMYDDGKVLITGGGGNPPNVFPLTNTSEVINLSRDNPTWRYVGSMNNARRQINTTLLADGQVLVTGGTSGGGFNNATGSVFAAEVWNPDTEVWTQLASAQSRRLYHSTAVLLPDGRVLVGGSGWPAAAGDFNHTDVEIFSPPYLFKGARPSVTSAPAAVNHGQQFFVGTPDAASVSKITLVRLNSTTHAFDQSQRINYLNFSQAAGGLNVTMTGSGNLCPPGYYMMFLVNSTGVPSVAHMIQVTVPGSPSNAIDDQRYFVRMHYYDYLNREPDNGGLNAWTNYILGCGNDAACRQTRRITTARGFMESGEFRRKVGGAFNPAFPGPGFTAYNAEYVRQCYIVYLKRNPGDVTNPSNEAYGWYNFLAQSGDYNTTIHGFIYSGEYRNRFYKP